VLVSGLGVATKDNLFTTHKHTNTCYKHNYTMYIYKPLCMYWLGYICDRPRGKDQNRSNKAA